MPKPMPRPVQYFSDEYLERCRALSPMDIVRFLDDFMRLYGPKPPATESDTLPSRTIFGRRLGEHGAPAIPSDASNATNTQRSP